MGAAYDPGKSSSWDILLEELKVPSSELGGPYRKHIPAPPQAEMRSNNFKYCHAECCQGIRDTAAECDGKATKRMLLPWFKAFLHWIRG